MNTTAGLVGDATDVPIFGVAIFSGYDVIFTNVAGERDGLGETGRNAADKIKLCRKALFVDKGAVGSHLHAGINGNKIGELASEGGGHTFDTICEVENTASVIHATSKQTSVGEVAGMGRSESAAFVFLATGAFARQKVRPGALNAGALDGFVNVEHDVLSRGEFDGFLIMIDAELGMMKFATTVDEHHTAGITGFDIMNVVEGIVIISVF